MKTRKVGITIFTLLLAIIITHSFAETQTEKAKIIPNYSYEAYDQFVNTLYEQFQNTQPDNLHERIRSFSKYFLGISYVLYPLGEGEKAEFDQQPLYRTDGFDCLTYVETVLALAHSTNLNEFKENILKLRYHRGIPIFVNRNHFTSTDWNINNANNGYIEDITLSIIDKAGKPIANISEIEIDKPNWYRKHTPQRIKYLSVVSDQKQNQLTSRLHELSKHVNKEKSTVAYLPLATLFNEENQPEQVLFDQIPDIAIVEIVRPNWELKDKIGTNLQISHLGFVIRDQAGALIYREASQIEGKIIDIPLIEYLRNYLDSPTVKGISVFAIVIQ